MENSKEPIWAAIQREWREGLESFPHLLSKGKGKFLGLDWKVLSIDRYESTSFDGDPIIYFKVVLADEVCKMEPKSKSGYSTMYETTRTLEAVMKEYLEPRNYRGLQFYFNYRSQSENTKLNNKGW